MATQHKEAQISATATLAEQSDEQLLLSYSRQENSAVFAELVSRYERELYNYLRRYLGDAAQAEDVFQATFLQVHVKRGSFETGRRFRPWLYTIATNQAIDSQRRTKRHRRMSLEQAMQPGQEGASLRDFVEGDEVDPAHVAEHGEQAQWIRDAVDALPEPLRKAVQLVYFRGMKYSDAAKLMSVPTGTVKSRMHAALQRLGQSWEDAQTATVRR